MSSYKHKEFILSFGRNLRKIRKSNGISQEELSNLSGLALSQIGRIERGEINTSLDIIQTIAISLKIKVSFLFEFEEDCDIESHA